MEIALFITVTIGSIAILLSLGNDFLQKDSLKAKKIEDDRIYKLSVIKEIQEKIAYTTDPEKVVDIIMISLRNFFNYSAASSMVIKDAHVVFKIYVEENIGPEYIKKIEESMLGSFEKLVGKLPLRIDKKIYGIPIDNTVKSIYSSSFHIPLIANNKVLAFIHLSSTKANAYSNMEDLHELIDAAQSALTHFSQAIGLETEKFSSLINSINDGIFMTDNKDNLLTINNSAKKLLEVGENADFFDVLNVFPQNFNLGSKINQVMLTKNPYFEKEIQINSKVLSIFVSPVGNDKASVVLHNMTEYKKKELLKEDLIHIMVHELRSPVTTIKDSAELIITTKNTLEEDRKLKFLEIIHQQAKKILGQIGSILDTAKLDAGKLVLSKTKGDIAKLIKGEIQTFIPQAQRKNISLSFNVVARSLPEISYDEIRISQVIDNLLSNSLKFTPENGKIQVEIDYSAISPVVDGTSPMGEFLSLDKYIVVSVCDNGVGIAQEQQKLLFSKYTQAKNTPEELATMGTGLGLYLVKGIIESHDGRIWVKSAAGQGTTFFFTLPATDNAKPSYDAPKPFTTPLAKLSQTVN
ncbi:MAG: Sensory box histidine kinase/response regulator [Candidatus Levybacteria bacterium GW2011_GWA2_37_36]|nr:MAG: Sensory box histidine kinase/response regulator [Candidatus Levybacteria bacterium GW2011_GWA2_37_36]